MKRSDGQHIVHFATRRRVARGAAVAMTRVEVGQAALMVDAACLLSSPFTPRASVPPALGFGFAHGAVDIDDAAGLRGPLLAIRAF